MAAWWESAWQEEDAASLSDAGKKVDAISNELRRLQHAQSDIQKKVDAVVKELQELKEQQGKIEAQHFMQIHILKSDFGNHAQQQPVARSSRKSVRILDASCSVFIERSHDTAAKQGWKAVQLL